jgi:hypothetical protein
MLHLSPSAKLKPRWFAQSSHSPLLPEHAWYRLDVGGEGGAGGGAKNSARKAGCFFVTFHRGRVQFSLVGALVTVFFSALVLCREVRRTHLHTHIHTHTHTRTPSHSLSLSHTHTHTHTSGAHYKHAYNFTNFSFDELKKGIKFHAHLAISCTCF